MSEVRGLRPAMKFSIRAMQRTDLLAVSRLLERVFGEKSPLSPNWLETLEWLYFSPEIKDRVPRALVIADGQTVVGHVGLTLSEFTDGDRSFTVVQTGNWAVDPNYKTGLLSLRLLVEAASLGDVAVVIDGSPQAQRIIPHIGYQKHQHIARYIKIVKPWSFLGMSRSGEQWLRNVGKLIVFVVGWLSGWLRRWIRSAEPIGQPHSPRKVLRNSLRPEFVNWYKQCPRGQVHVLRCSRDGVLLGQAVLLLQWRKGNCYANILHVDVATEDDSAWIAILDAIEEFLKGKQVTHINAIGTYEPWCRALRDKGYGRLKTMIFWLRDKSGRVADVSEWHLTAIEGDLGYLLE